MSGYTYVDHLQVINGFCVKADGKDKLTALIQYVCMFISNNEPGNVKKIQASVTAGRKIFRVMRPLECITPLLINPGFDNKSDKVIQALNKIKALLMAIYFAADHGSWAFNIGLITDKEKGERFGKISLYSWGIGSVIGAVVELLAISKLSVNRKEGESEEDFNKRVEAVRKEVNQRLFVFVHAIVQAITACGLAGLIQMSGRKIGFFGSVASAMNCWLLLPSYPVKAVKPKSA